MTRDETFEAIAADLDLCDIGMALTKGAARRKFVKHRKACIAEIARLNKEDGLADMTIDEIMKDMAEAGL